MAEDAPDQLAFPGGEPEGEIPPQGRTPCGRDRGTLCCGLDEVGRGALAGPLVAAAAVLPDDFVGRLGPLAPFLRDSKTVPKARRVRMAELIRAHALAVEVEVLPVEDINVRGIGWANREAFRRLIARVAADLYIVDGRVAPLVAWEQTGRVRCQVKADAAVPAVSAASLVAKVYRDTLMAELHCQYPAFGWDANAGYGTPAHLAALRIHGATPVHRTVFVATALGGGQRGKRAKRGEMATADAELDALLT